MTNLKFANVSEVDASTGKVKVDFIEDGITSDWLPMLVRKTKEDKHFYLPDVGEHVACLMDEHLERGVIMGSIYSQKNQPGSEAAEGVESVEFSDGTIIKYDRSAHKLTIQSENVEIIGDLVVSGEVTAKNQVPAEKITLSQHIHTSSGFGAPTSTPTPGI